MNAREKRAAEWRAFWEQHQIVPYGVFQTMSFDEAHYIAYALHVYRNRKRYPRQWRIIREIAEMGVQLALRGKE